MDTEVESEARARRRSGASARTAVRPLAATVWYRGIPCLLDLKRCRRALLYRQVEGDVDSMEGLANAAGVSRSTASRFFAGRPTSVGAALKILGVLRLSFDEVATPMGDDLTHE
jgi:hypothetical protein